jgi:hypothetical protein
VGQPSEPRFLVLHGLRLKGFAEPEAIGAAVGLDAGTVESHLPSLRDDDLVLRREGRLTGWALTTAGRKEQEHLAAKELADTGTAPAVRVAYEEFLGINGDLLAVCTDWQLRGGAINDHTDEAHDAEVVARLGTVHDAVGPILASLRATLARFAPYEPRLHHAIAQVRAGDREFFTKPIIDSFHTVWFELHEDLLTSLGLERSQEAPH